MDGSQLVEIPKETDETVLDVMNDTLVVSKKRLIEKVVNKDVRRYKPDIYVLKWVDYSQKYGFAYLLSNDTLGINFNDNTRLVMDSDYRHITYWEISKFTGIEVSRCFTIAWPPEELKKKTLILQHMWSYLDGNDDRKQLLRKALENIDKGEENLGQKREHNHDNVIYVRKWNQTKHASFFHLSTKLIQINFSDGTEIILGGRSSEFGKDVFTYVKRGKRQNFALSEAMKDFGRKDKDKIYEKEMLKKLKYSKDIIFAMKKAAGEEETKIQEE